MSDLNQVIIIGRCVSNMELKYIPSGTAVSNFSLAVNETYTSNGQKVENCNFFDVVLFGKVADALKPYLLKGKQVAITGKLKQERWEKDGKTHTRVKIIASNIQLLGGNSKPAEAPKPVESAPVVDDFEDDIPF